MADPVGRTLGPYQIIEKIGEGGMAAVYKAYQPSLNRFVAVKILPPLHARQPGFSQRFRREAEAIANLNHPNILPVYDSGQDDGYSFIVMRFVEGAHTLKDVMTASLSLTRAADLIAQVAAALDYAHRQGVVHRDVKPGNVLMDGDWALLTDFGLAKMTEASVKLTGTGVGIGTPAYMSPEQGQGLPVDHRTDIYSLGIILFEMLTGQIPHNAETPVAIVFKRATEPVPMPRTLNPSLPEAVERVILKALAREADHRFTSAGALAMALKEAVSSAGDEAFEAPPALTEEWATTPLQATPPSTEADRTSPLTPAPARSALPWKWIAAVVSLALVVVGLAIALVNQGEPLPTPADTAPAVAVASTPTAPSGHTLVPATGSPLPSLPPETPEATDASPEADTPPQADTPAPVQDLASTSATNEWSASGHADAAAEPFIHWDSDDPPQIPIACARCHSTPGYLDFAGADGTQAGVVDNAAPTGTVVECAACHNDIDRSQEGVVMPSGVEITGLGQEAQCLACHQGRNSAAGVDAALEQADVDEDAVSEELGFLNIHYYAAAATQYGTVAKGGYEYEGKSYDANFAHVDEFDTCIECHNPHSLEVQVNACTVCHTGVTGVDDLKKVRMPGSGVDYDGDGDVGEGVYYELRGLQEILYEAIQAYAAEVVGTPIVYDARSYPYFFIDTNADGEKGEDEADRYNTWTPRLVKAAYNYQVSVKDPDAFAHGGKYIIQLLYDSIEDLDPGAAAGLARIDAGHFAGSEEAFRHWDEEGEVPESCSKCHSAGGLPIFLKEGVTISQPMANGFQCTTCHDDLATFTRYEVAEVEFPSGAVIDSGDANMNLCMNCHQGRESAVSVNQLTAGMDDDTVSDELRFLNIHYFAAGATRFGTEAKGAYEYDGKEYLGLFPHVEPYSSCTQCHSAHGLDVKAEECGVCHMGVKSEEDLTAIRMATTDYDSDGDTTEGIAGEIATMREALYAATQDYATNVVGTDAVYDAHSYPYWFADDGERYTTWTPRLLRAAYNYQYVTKDPGAFAHNGKYIIQVLYDGLEDIGGDVSGMVRPE